MAASMLPSEKLELAVYKHVNALHSPVSVSLAQLAQITGANDHARIAECLKGLEADNRILLTKYKGGLRLSRQQFGNDGGFFHTDSFLIEIAPLGRKYFEELAQRAEQETKKPLVVAAAPGEPLIFVSCGQSTPAERQLGQQIAELVEKETGHRAYFAENQNTLEGVTENILKRLHTAAGFIAIMHPRGDVSSSATGKTWVRGSVWVEQEIAIAAFIAQALQQPMRVRAYVHESILREGLRDKLHLNPKSFREDLDILTDLAYELPSWRDLTQSGDGEFEAAHRRLAESKVGKLSPASKKLVIYLLHHGKTELNALATKCQPPDQFYDAIQQASREGLVQDTVAGNPARPGTLYYWEINPMFEAALRDLLKGEHQ